MGTQRAHLQEHSLCAAGVYNSGLAEERRVEVVGGCLLLTPTWCVSLGWGLPHRHTACTSVISDEKFTRDAMLSVEAISAMPMLTPMLIAVVCFLLVVVIVLLIERSQYRATAPASSATLTSSSAASPAQGTAAPASTATNGKREWWSSPLASDAENEIIRSAMKIVCGADLEPLPPHADLEMLRLLRTFSGRGDVAKKLAELYCKHLRWRRKHVLWPIDATARVETSQQLWSSAVDHGHGQWALNKMHIGLNIGRARGGHVVKIERVGVSDISGICNEKGGDERLLGFYYSLLDTILIALNHESAQCGTLLRMYAHHPTARGPALLATSPFMWCRVVGMRSSTSRVSRRSRRLSL